MPATIIKVKKQERITWNEPVTAQSLVADFEENLKNYQNIIKDRYVSRSHAAIANELQLLLNQLKSNHPHEYSLQVNDLVEALEKKQVHQRGWLGEDSYLYALIRTTFASYKVLAKQRIATDEPLLEKVRELSQEKEALALKNQQLQKENQEINDVLLCT